MPFDDHGDNPPQTVRQTAPRRMGVKLNNQNSIVASLPKKPSPEVLEKRATEANEQLNAHAAKALELTPQFKKMLEDKTLPQNKSTFALEAEAELLGKLIQLGVDMNFDELEDSGMGSIGLISLALKMLVFQRDRINLLDYQLSQQKRELEALQTKVKPLLDTAIDAGK